MVETRPVFHGSDVEKICEYYHLKEEEIVKFGANVNPLGLSDKVKDELAKRLDVLSSYPDRDYTSLRETIGEYCGVPSNYILVGNGSSELISLLIEVRFPKRTLILGPTYSEYSRELSLSGSIQEEYNLKEADEFQLDVKDLCSTLEENQYDFLIICNPNNPTSSAISTGEMEELLAFCEQRNIFVMIDETYVEFAPVVEAVTAVPLTSRFHNLMILRGVSKFFAAPGMRLGYGITGNIDFLKKMKEKQIPWSLNSLGVLGGELMLKDEEYRKRTRELILSERDRLYYTIQKMPLLKTYQPYANFLLVKILHRSVSAFDVFEHCIKQGLMIRDCTSFECLNGEYIRFCVMSKEDNTRLIKALETIPFRRARTD